MFENIFYPYGKLLDGKGMSKEQKSSSGKKSGSCAPEWGRGAKLLDFDSLRYTFFEFYFT